MPWSLWFYTYYIYPCSCTGRESPDRDPGEKKHEHSHFQISASLSLRSLSFDFQEISYLMTALLTRASEFSELFHYAPLVFLFFFLALSEPVFVLLNILCAELCPCSFFPKSILHLLSLCTSSTTKVLPIERKSRKVWGGKFSTAVLPFTTSSCPRDKVSAIRWHMQSLHWSFSREDHKNSVASKKLGSWQTLRQETEKTCLINQHAAECCWKLEEYIRRSIISIGVPCCLLSERK